MDSNKIATDILLDMHKNIGVMREDIAEIKADLNLHMKRTAQLETELKYVHKHITMVQGVGAFLGVIAAVAAIYKNFFI